MQASRKKHIIFYTLVMIVVTFFSGGCFKSMALNEKTQALNTATESVALFTVKTSNEFKPSYQPHVSHVHVEQILSAETKENLIFSVDGAYKEEKNLYDEYLVSLSLPPGKYTLRQVTGTSGIFPIHGTFAATISAPFEIAHNKIVYLGRIEATVHERNNSNEPRAGIVIPLIDQAVAGFSTGTFAVKLFDNYDADMAVFIQKYPVLKNYTVEKTVFSSLAKPEEADMTK